MPNACSPLYPYFSLATEMYSSTKKEKCPQIVRLTIQILQVYYLHFVSGISLVGDQTNKARSLSTSGFLSTSGIKGGQTAW